MRLRTLVSCTLVGALSLVSLSACSYLDHGGTITTVSSPSALEDLKGAQGGVVTRETFYSQHINWKKCNSQQVSDGTSLPNGNSFECAVVKAPMEWEHPEGKQINLQIARHLSEGQAKGNLFYNLGGPGGVAVASLKFVTTDLLGKNLVKDFNIVAMDPRGVGESTPVVCLTDAERDKETGSIVDEGTTNTEDTAEQNNDSASPQERINAINDKARKFGEKCIEKSGDIVAHVDTVSTANDLDMMRSLVGDHKLSYIGFSYGTFLGDTYADLFPKNVGRMVLDGALDPALTSNEVEEMQYHGIDQSISHWLQKCVSTKGCPFTGNEERAQADLKKFLKGLDSKPLKTGSKGRVVTRKLALSTIISCMYSTEYYELLSQVLSQAIQDGDGSMLLKLSDLLNERKENGKYASNSLEALQVINFLDYSPTETAEQVEAQYQRMRKELPILGDFLDYPASGIAGWPIKKHAERKPITAPDAPPIVVIGTTHDPATPLAMAQNMAKQLRNGVLITWDGWNHTAYNRSGSKCVAHAVEDYLITGTVPKDGLQCTN